MSVKDQSLFPLPLQELLISLHQKFNSQRLQLLANRDQRQKEYDAGSVPTFVPQGTFPLDTPWQVAPIPACLMCRRVEITGPVNSTKMVINMLSKNEAGVRADMAMLDFEDSMMPSFKNVLDGYQNVIGAVSGNLSWVQNDKTYKINLMDMAYPMVRVRGLHLSESNVLIDEEPMSAGLLDLATCFFHTAKIYLSQGKVPKFYIPKCEHYEEAAWWDKLFVALEQFFDLSLGTLKATFLIETLPAAFQIEEILYVTRNHIVGLNVGRWDKIFSDIKTLGKHADRILADRSTITMLAPWMENYAKRVIHLCHKRGAFAMGGMAAFTPGKTAKLREEQTAKVIADKKREFEWGHDGCWVSHPYFIGPALQSFLVSNQLNVKLQNFATDCDLLPQGTGPKTLQGLKTNIRVGIAYLHGWQQELGCVAWDNLMEDLATLEISRAQVWQWLYHRITLDDGTVVTPTLVSSIFQIELQKIILEFPQDAVAFKQAAMSAEKIFLKTELTPFLTMNSPVAKYSNENLENNLLNQNHIYQEVTMSENKTQKTLALESEWKNSPRWKSVKRTYTAQDVMKLRGNVEIAYSLATQGAERLWNLLQNQASVRALGALTGNQAMQQVKAGLDAIYLSGWQVAADANLAGQMYPDQSLYPANSVPDVVRKINKTLQRADQIDASEGKNSTHWMAPIIADAEAGFGGALNSFELMKAMIEAGAAAVHFEDQLASEKKCGHLGGKVLVPTSQFIKTLTAARLAADVMGVPSLIIARTDANGAQLITSDIDDVDKKYLTGERTAEGFYRIKGGLDIAITRGLAYAPYADLVWCETSTPDLQEAARFAEAIHKFYPNKMLAYNCSPSFNWKKHLDEKTIAAFQTELASMGYKFQFVTLAGFHALNHSMYQLASSYKTQGMAAYSKLQEEEFAAEAMGYTATKHQREVGTSYFDLVSTIVSGGASSTLAYKGSTEIQQFN